MIAFGPVPSRRLGRSLGINNIVSHKSCTYSCIYCQIGITHRQSKKRVSFYEPVTLVDEVEKHLEKLKPEFKPDYLTFVANGEPTLDINIGKEIRMLKKFNTPIAVITNSSLMHHASVREELMEADWVSVKVDATENSIWEKVNQPDVSLVLNKIMSGLEKFAESYRGMLHTETMLVNGCNDSRIAIAQTASFIASLHPLKAYISVPIRPTAVQGVKTPDEEKLVDAWQIFRKMGITAELLTGFEGTNAGSTGNAFEDILNITAVHPLREDTMKELLKQDKTDENVIHSLIAQGLIKGIVHDGKTFYVRSYHLQ